MKDISDYIIGLDIGSNSCGYVATDLQNNILKLHRKTAIGSRLFEEGKTAADTRGFRTTSRRIKRRRRRIALLNELLDNEIAKTDPTFFARLKESSISPLDSRKRFESIIFDSKDEEAKFYSQDKYPTIYHLRNALMNDDQKHDIREVYIAIHHIIKYRGNFLHSDPVSTFSASKIDVASFIDGLNEYMSSIIFDGLDDVITIPNDKVSEIEEALKDHQMAKKDKQKQIAEWLTGNYDDKNAQKISKNLAKEIANAILGYKFKFYVLANIDDTNKAIKFSDANADDKIAEWSNDLQDDQVELLDQLHMLYGSVVLDEIVPEGMTLSQSMIKKYDQHKKDLALLKAYLRSLKDNKKKELLQAIYDAYVGNKHADIAKYRTLTKSYNLDNFDDFKKAINKCLDKSELAEQINARLESGEFLPKQRTNQNGVIPYQIHQIELDKIIEKQSKHYPFLAEENPVKSHLNNAPYKLDELLAFRVPYYVGPMVDPEYDQSERGKSNSSFAWMKRKEAGEITPWNFDEKVDRIESANNFIRRMTTKDTYLIGEDVLPASSLIYQEFTVLNELNNIRINGAKLNNEEKVAIINDLFKTTKTISAKKFTNYLEKNGYIAPTIEGLSDPKKFNSTLSTYIDFKNIFNDLVDDKSKLNDLERIIEWSTIFEDREIFEQKLHDISWLTDEQIKKVSTKRYSGWGRLSKKLLTQITDDNGVSILQRLRNENENFMQIMADDTIKQKIVEANSKMLTGDKAIEDILDEAYTSPQNKKAIRQVMRVVKDIVKAANGKMPKQISIEFARSANKDPKITQSRKASLENVYKEISDEILIDAVKKQLKDLKDNRQLAKDKLYLYFTQGGLDAYTGERIDIDNLQNYDIDHILPQSFIKDDSLDNRVLVARAINNEKSDNVPLKIYGHNQAKSCNLTIAAMWKRWANLRMISKKKLSNLLTDPSEISEYKASGFVKRQLVETSQVIKLVATILQNEYPDTEIIEVRASSNSILRKEFDLYKSREVNDYHHAIDAYLTTIVGNYLYQVYPKLRKFFVYGQFKKFSDSDVLKHMKHFNFLSGLTKEGETDEIKISGTDEVVFKRSEIIKKLKEAYNFKYMNVSQETRRMSGALFNQTIYPTTKRDTAKNRSLIPIKNDLDPEIYGGYSGNKDAYLALVKIEKAKDTIYKVFGIPVRIASKLEDSSGSDKLLNEFFAEKFKDKKGIKSFRILKSRIPFKQAVIDGQEKFMMGSSTYKYNLKQLALSSESMKYILDYIDDPEFKKHKCVENQMDAEDCLIFVYDEILKIVDKYLPLYDINKFRPKLREGRKIFVDLDFDEMVKTIYSLLNGLHANPVFGDLKLLNIKTPFGQMQAQTGITLSENAMLLYQSPTGLFERRVKIKDL